jgi:hypothetical protein
VVHGRRHLIGPQAHGVTDIAARGVSRALLLGSALVALGVACASPQAAPVAGTAVAANSYPDRQELRADPAAQIQMPRTDELRAVGAERHTTPEGDAGAFDGGIFGADATPAEVHAFYDAALRQQGWQPDTYGVFSTSTDLNVWGWCKPGRLFRVAILDPDAFAHSLTKSRPYPSLFHATINGRAPDVPCPSH